MRPDYQRPWAEILNDVREWDFRDLTLDVEPDDRVGALPSRFKSRLRRLIGVLIVAGIAWTVVRRSGTSTSLVHIHEISRRCRCFECPRNFREGGSRASGR